MASVQSILMATDLSARSDRALDRAIVLARNLGAELTIIHVVDEGLPTSLAHAQHKQASKTIQQHIDSLTAGNGPSISIEVVLGRAHVGILEMCQTVEAEIIVLGLHREDAFKDMFRGTTAERVIRAGNTPVLLVKDRVSGPYHRIMVGVDFSVYSRRAVEFAVSLFPSAEFHLVHAFYTPFKGFLKGDDTRREFLKLQESRLHEMVEQEMAIFLASLRTKEPKLERVLQEGSVLEVIRRQKDLLNPDLLIVGTHGRTGVSRAFLGSVAEDLLRVPPCDVLVVKAW